MTALRSSQGLSTNSSLGQSSARPKSSCSSSPAAVLGSETIRNTPPIFSRRAREIQADEGINLRPSPYLNPALRDGATPAEQNGISIQTHQATSNGTISPPFASGDGSRLLKGRARAGTLPSSWVAEGSGLSEGGAQEGETQERRGEGTGAIGDSLFPSTRTHLRDQRSWNSSLGGSHSSSSSSSRVSASPLASRLGSMASDASLSDEFVGARSRSGSASASSSTHATSTGGGSGVIGSGGAFTTNVGRLSSITSDDYGHQPDPKQLKRLMSSDGFLRPTSSQQHASPAAAVVAQQRLRSGSLASTLPGLGNNAFGPSIFSTWPEDDDRSLTAIGRSGSRLGAHSSSSANVSRSSSRLHFSSFDDQLDSPDEGGVQTLDYLGLTSSAKTSANKSSIDLLRRGDDEENSNTAQLAPRASVGGSSGLNRNRASTLATTSRPHAQRSSLTYLSTNGSLNAAIDDHLSRSHLRPRPHDQHYHRYDRSGENRLEENRSAPTSHDDSIAAYALEHGLDPREVAATVAAVTNYPVPNAQLHTNGLNWENGSGQSQNVAGRNRAGTVAAVPGPDGRERAQQELLRMLKASGLNTASAEVQQLISSLRESHSNPQYAPLEGFPHVNLPTPPLQVMNQGLSHSPMYSPSSARHQISSPTSPAIVGPSMSRSDAITENKSATNSSDRLPAQSFAPTRSLWVGNLHATTTGQDLMSAFAPYGAIESLRLLPEKECGFVNFVEMADAIRARDDVLGRLGGRLGSLGTGPSSTVRVGFGKADLVPVAPSSYNGAPGLASHEATLSSSPRFDSMPSSQPMTPGASDGSQPTRALWVGSIPGSTTAEALLSVFQPFGPIESARVLGHKNCGFVNYERLDDAVRARKMLQGRDPLGTEVGPMKIGFAKVPSKNQEQYPMQTGEGMLPNHQAAVDALSEVKGASGAGFSTEQQIQSGRLEDYRSNLVLNLLNNEQKQQLLTQPPHQQQFPKQQQQQQQQQQQSQQQQQQQQSFEAVNRHDQLSRTQSPVGIHVRAGSLTGNSSSSSIVPSSDKGGVPLPPQMVPRPSVTDLQLLMRQMSEGEPDAEIEADVASVSEYRPPATYYTSIPLVSDVSITRRFDTSRLRELRRGIENGQMSSTDCDALASDYLDCIVELASDYLGNTLVQKLFECCSEGVKNKLLQRLAPHLATIGCHKNGTWAAQKIIDCAQTEEQFRLIAQYLRPYVPPLLLDQFGNYVVQCCLRWREGSDFVFDAMVDRCWEIAQGRFGARSIRGCLMGKIEPTSRQKKRVAIAIILNSLPLATSPNGSLLLAWLLDNSGIAGRYRLLAPRLSPHLGELCTHKLASQSVLKVALQTVEPQASEIILGALFDSPNDKMLEEILTDQLHGSGFFTKILSSLESSEKPRYIEQVKRIVSSHRLAGVPAYRTLIEELGIRSPAALAGYDTHFGSELPSSSASGPMAPAFSVPIPAAPGFDVRGMMSSLTLGANGNANVIRPSAPQSGFSRTDGHLYRPMSAHQTPDLKTATAHSQLATSTSASINQQADAFNPCWDASASYGSPPTRIPTSDPYSTGMMTYANPHLQQQHYSS